MDNLTHSLVGLTAAKAGLEKLSPGATLLCLIAANAPDGDIFVLVQIGHVFSPSYVASVTSQDAARSARDRRMAVE